MAAVSEPFDATLTEEDVTKRMVQRMADKAAAKQRRGPGSMVDAAMLERLLQALEKRKHGEMPPEEDDLESLISMEELKESRRQR
jgi:hypothetical protein